MRPGSGGLHRQSAKLPFNLSVQPVLVLDATLETGFSDGGAVANAKDWSANNFTVAGLGSTANPTWVADAGAALNHQAAYRFTGASNQGFTIAHNAKFTPATITIVVEMAVSSYAAFQGLFGKHSSGAWSDGYGCYDVSATKQSFWVNGFNTHHVEQASNDTANTGYIYIFEYDLTNLTSRRNGTSVTSAYNAAISYSGTPAFQIGMVTGGSLGFNGWIKRMAVFGGALNSNDWALLEATEANGGWHP